MNAYRGLARQDTAGGTLLPWEGSFYASSRRARFEAWSSAALRAAAVGQKIRADDAGGKTQWERAFSLSLSLPLLEPLTRRVLVQSIPHYYYHDCCTSPPVPCTPISTIYIPIYCPNTHINPLDPAVRFLQIGATLRPTHAGTLGTLTSASR
jgi:hypothetical protein